MQSLRSSDIVSAVTGFLVLPALLLAQHGLSHVRVVRVSYVSGTIAIKRPTSTEWTKAMVNTPVQEGFALSTSSNSFTEVEFENGSTARLGELSRVNFTQLAMDSDGNKINHLTLEGGYATFHFQPEHKDLYSVNVDDVTISPHANAEFRTDLDGEQLRVVVFNGSVTIATPSGTRKLGKDEALTLNTRTEVASNIQHGIQKDAWDRWVESRDTQAQLAQKDSAVGLNGSLYGWSDLDAYGDWAFFPGYGYGWAPYEPTGWSPYSMGMWDSYPAFGWTWIGGEPWGWLPYHYGLWNYDAMFGWFWMPGSFGMWSPALVDWYGGAGWIGWLPARCQYGIGVAALPTATFQRGGPIQPNDLIRMNSWEGRLTSAPSYLPRQKTLFPEFPLGPSSTLPGNSARGESTSPQASPRSRPGPATVLMGNSPGSERAVLNAHRNFWARALGGAQPQPLRARLGTALGGARPLGGLDSAGFEVLHGGLGGIGGVSTFGSASSRPVLLPHGGALGRTTASSQGGFVGRMGSGEGFSSGLAGHISSGIGTGGHSSSGGSGHR
jgi:FecR protein